MSTNGKREDVRDLIDTETRPSCPCGAPAAACSWEGDTRREWACSACHALRTMPIKRGCREIK